MRVAHHSDNRNDTFVVLYRFVRGLNTTRARRKIKSSILILLPNSGLLSLPFMELDNSWMKMHKKEVRKAGGALL